MPVEAYEVIYSYGVMNVKTETSNRIFRLDAIPPDTGVRIKITVRSKCQVKGKSYKAYDRTGEIYVVRITKSSISIVTLVISLCKEFTHNMLEALV